MAQTIRLSDIRIPQIDDESIFSGRPEPCADARELFDRYTLVAPGETVDRLRAAFRYHGAIVAIDPVPQESCPFEVIASVVPMVIHTLILHGQWYEKRCAQWFKKPTPSPIQHVYFFYCDAGRESRVKIGISQNVDVRRKCVANNPPFPISCIGFIPNGGRSLERKLHKSFAHLREHGEWFRATPELLAYIKQEAQPWPKRN